MRIQVALGIANIHTFCHSAKFEPIFLRKVCARWDRPQNGLLVRGARGGPAGRQSVSPVAAGRRVREAAPAGVGAPNFTPPPSSRASLVCSDTQYRAAALPSRPSLLSSLRHPKTPYPSARSSVRLSVVRAPALRPVHPVLIRTRCCRSCASCGPESPSCVRRPYPCPSAASRFGAAWRVRIG